MPCAPSAEADSAAPNGACVAKKSDPPVGDRLCKRRRAVLLWRARSRVREGGIPRRPVRIHPPPARRRRAHPNRPESAQKWRRRGEKWDPPPRGAQRRCASPRKQAAREVRRAERACPDIATVFRRSDHSARLVFGMAAYRIAPDRRRVTVRNPTRPVSTSIWGVGDDVACIYIRAPSRPTSIYTHLPVGARSVASTGRRLPIGARNLPKMWGSAPHTRPGRRP